MPHLTKLKQINAICGNQPESSPSDQCSCSKLYFPNKHNTYNTRGGFGRLSFNKKLL